jgi:hypothetical protein
MHAHKTLGKCTHENQRCDLVQPQGRTRSEAWANEPTVASRTRLLCDDVLCILLLPVIPSVCASAAIASNPCAAASYLALNPGAPCNCVVRALVITKLQASHIMFRSPASMNMQTGRSPLSHASNTLGTDITHMGFIFSCMRACMSRGATWVRLRTRGGGLPKLLNMGRTACASPSCTCAPPPCRYISMSRPPFCVHTWQCTRVILVPHHACMNQSSLLLSKKKACVLHKFLFSTAGKPTGNLKPAHALNETKYFCHA